jgi:Tol biopolymer transport system component/tRNA A-37 threonylcarbamoyl transferase component Bud32
MGEVYKARDIKLKRDVALKVLPEALANDPERRARFEREAQALAALNHPNIGAIYGLEDSTDGMALIMELVDGGPLTDRFSPTGMPLIDAVSLAVQIASGLEAAHKVGIVHRDLKPGNVLVTSAGVVKLVDFGLAKLLSAPELVTGDTATQAANPATEQGLILGTVAYMSPEQAQGKSIDARSDLFSFGTLFYEMLTGMRPFEGENAMSTLAAILREDPKPPNAVRGGALPRDAERIVLRCLRKDPDRRFQTAADLRLALEDLKEDTSSGTVGPTTAAASAARSRWPWVVASGICLATVVTSGIFVWTRPKTPASPPLRQMTFEAGVALTPTLSPDGKLVAFASDRSGERHLDIWLRQTAGGEPVRLTSGSDSKVSPQFSPDGTRIFYLGGRNELDTVPALGGPSRRVLDKAGPFAMSSHGEIVFYRPGIGNASSIFILPATGGSPEAWHPECVTVGVPAWSPDGGRLAFFGFCGEARTDSRRSPDLMLASRTGASVSRVSTVDIPGVGLDVRPLWIRLRSGTEALIVPLRAGDSVNLYLVGFDGTKRQVTQGTGVESWPAISPSGELIFTRSEQVPSVWSLDVRGHDKNPTKEASPARMFGTSRDGTKLVFGRMLGMVNGQLVLRDRASGTETVLAAHSVILEGAGSFWPQVSPDGRRILYRVFAPPTFGHYLVSADGGTPRFLSAAKDFGLVSDWSPDGTRVLGECQPITKGICELDPDDERVRVVLQEPAGGQLLYPSYSWDGKWMVFMLRRSGRTVICVTPVRHDGTFESAAAWVGISPDDAESARPRFSPDGSSVYYESTRGSVVTLVRQQLDPVTRRTVEPPLPLAIVQTIPSGLFLVPTVNTLSVTRDRLFFNNIDAHSNIWMTTLPE